MKRRTFKNELYQKQFDTDGFLVVDLLSPEKINELKEICYSYILKDFDVNTESSYKLSFFKTSKEEKKSILLQLGKFFQPMVENILDDYEPLIINIFDKSPGSGEVPIHQNWTFVDEDKYVSVSIWVPLQDVSHDNGTLEVVKGSHNVVSKFRGPTIPWSFAGLENELKSKYLQPFNIKAGMAAIIDDSILHWSSENNSNENRLAVQLILKPKEAQAIHYFRDEVNNPDVLDVYGVDSDFFSEFDMKVKPAGVQKIDEVPYKKQLFSEEELVNRISVQNPGILHDYKTKGNILGFVGKMINKFK